MVVVLPVDGAIRLSVVVVVVVVVVLNVSFHVCLTSSSVMCSSS